jgi:PAS domain S-box-containing protein
VRGKTSQTLFQLMEHAPFVFWVFDPQNVETVYINRACESMWGQSLESIYRRPFSFLDVVHPEDQARARTMLKRQSRYKATVEDFRIEVPGGDLRWVRDSSFPLKIKPEGIVYVAGTVEYITRSYRTRRRVKYVTNKAWSNSRGALRTTLTIF